MDTFLIFLVSIVSLFVTIAFLVNFFRMSRIIEGFEDTLNKGLKPDIRLVYIYHAIGDDNRAKEILRLNIEDFWKNEVSVTDKKSGKGVQIVSNRFKDEIKLLGMKACVGE